MVVVLLGVAVSGLLCLLPGCGELGDGAAQAIETVATQAGDTPQPISFNSDIRPILSDNCFACHGPDSNAREADLRLDMAEDGEGYFGAYSVIMPGNPEAGELVYRIHSDNSRVVMPPPDSHLSLTEDEIALLERWIEEGAAYEPHWSFVPVVRPELPEVPGDDWSRNGLDAFVYARLTDAGISPSPEADRLMWLRRVTQDLTGLPPTVEEVDAFVADDSPEAYERVVDRLLNSVAYAERMAVVWLDNARYADSNGFQFDNRRTQWPWRDWVIDAFAQNMPYDQFITEQLAGDLLPDHTEDQLLATAFNRNHPTTIEGGVIHEEYRVMNVNDRTTTFGTLFLGLTFECARCHDHKYDPVSTEDYYELYAFFNNSADPGHHNRGQAPPPFIQRDGVNVMVMGEQERESFVLIGGQFDQYGDPVEPDTPDVLPGFGERERNRLGLADWLFDDNNPLTARVTVNRMWQMFFGRGLVPTPDNLGFQAEMPTHPALLDWLAAELRDNGWDLHHLFRTIVLSATYRQDSAHRTDVDDPDNRLLARGPSFRLPAEMIRDQALFASGLLTTTVGGPSVFPYQPDGIWEDLNAPASHAETYTQSTGEDLYRRSLYTYWRRAALHPGMSVFDATNRDVCTVTREATNTPLQALAMMHDTTYVEASRALAELVIHATGPEDVEAQAILAMRRTVTRQPTNDELGILLRLYERQLNRYREDAQLAANRLAVGESAHDEALDSARVAAMADVCLAIFNLSETITRK